MKKKFMLFALLIFQEITVYSQEDSLITYLKNIDFEKKIAWMNEYSQPKGDTLSFVKKVNTAIFLSIKEGKYISNDFLKNIINKSKNYEFEYHQSRHNKVDSIDYSLTTNLVDSIINLPSRLNQLFLVDLLKIQNTFLLRSNLKENYLSYQKNLFTIINLESDEYHQKIIDYNDTNLDYAWELIKSNKKNEAYPYFDYVFNATCRLISDVKPSFSQSMSNQLYISGRGIIESCRYNKEKMISLSKYNFIVGDLDQYYEKAMNEVGEKVDWDKE